MEGKSLDILVGEKLSSVVFVMDYLQVDFDGNQFTFFIWPVVAINNVKYHFGDTAYRDMLCSLITQVVVSATFADNEKLEVSFANGSSLYLSLDPDNPDIVGEIAHFTDVDNNWYVFQ